MFGWFVVGVFPPLNHLDNGSFILLFKPPVLLVGKPAGKLVLLAQSDFGVAVLV